MDEGTPPAIEQPKDTLSKSTVAKIIVATILGAALVVFAAQNTDRVDVDFLSWTITTPNIVLILLSAAIGIIVWELIGFRRRRNRP